MCVCECRQEAVRRGGMCGHVCAQGFKALTAISVYMCMGYSPIYLVIVVVGQTLAIKSHPPPLKNTFSAKRRRVANSIQLAH